MGKDKFRLKTRATTKKWHVWVVCSLGASLCYRYKLNITALHCLFLIYCALEDGGQKRRWESAKVHKTHKSSMIFPLRITIGAMPYVLLSLHIYFYQTISCSQSAAGSFHGSLEEKMSHWIANTIRKKPHWLFFFPVFNEQWWSRH